MYNTCAPPTLVLSMCSYIKWLIKIIKHKKGTEEDVYTTWERDYDLMPNNVQGLFNEYLELGMTTL